MSPSSPIVPSTGLTGKSSPGAMARAPGLRRRVKNSVNVGYSSMGRSASLMSTPYLRAKARITARTTGLGALARHAAPTARDSVFFGSRRNSVYDSSAIGLRCLAGRSARRYCGCWPCAAEGGPPGGGGHLLALGAFLRQLYAAFLDGAEHGLRALGIDRAGIDLSQQRHHFVHPRIGISVVELRGVELLVDRGRLLEARVRVVVAASRGREQQKADRGAAGHDVPPRESDGFDASTAVSREQVSRGGQKWVVTPMESTCRSHQRRPPPAAASTAAAT